MYLFHHLFLLVEIETKPNRKFDRPKYSNMENGPQFHQNEKKQAHSAQQYAYA